MPIKNKHTSNLKVRKIALLALALLVLLGVGLFAYKKMHHATPVQKPTGQTPDINYRPPTKEEKQAGNDIKQQIVDQEQQQKAAQNQSGLRDVTPVVTYASLQQVNAYVSGVFEDGGTCTATFTQNGTIITRSSTGFENVSYSQCAPITPDLPNTNPWSLVLSYKSATAQGSAKAVEVK